MNKEAVMNTQTTKIKVYQKLLFGAGDLAGCFSNTIIGFFYLFYLTDVVALRPAYAGAAILLGRVWDAVTDPIIGMISDRTQSRFGRRRVFLLLGSLPLGLSFFLLWIIPPGFTQFQMFIFASLSYMLHMTALTAVVVPYQTLTVEMTSDYDERTSLTAYRMIFSILGGLVGVVLPKMIIDGYSVQTTGYLMMAVVFSLCIGTAPLFPFAGCRENGTPTNAPFLPVKDFKNVWNNKPFRFILFMFLSTWTAINMLETMFMYFFKYWLKMDNQFDIIMGLIFIVAALFLPVWVKVSSKMGKKYAYILGVGFLGICILGVIFIKPTSVWPIYIISFLIGIGISAAHVMPHSIIPDSIDFGQVQTGEQAEGMYYGFLTFLQKIGTASAIGVSGVVLDLMGYVPNAVQSGKVLWSIRILFGPIPGLMLLIGILCIYYYPIDRKMYGEMRKQIGLRKDV
jgi:glycoside/pentoside/hexuronide:cation symporter, GPH family